MLNFEHTLEIRHRILKRQPAQLRYRLRHPFRFHRLRKQSQEHRCIFIHIPKCAGTSLRQSLALNAGGHRTIMGYRTMLPRTVFESCFKFTFVRNPWDRLASAFFFLKNENMESNHKWARKHLADFDTFENFVRRWVTRETVWLNSHFLPQFHFVTLEDTRPAVDFIGYYENLADDFSFICERLKVRVNLREENQNPRRSRDFREYYDDETRQIVADAYAEDIKLFGYTFDNASLPLQLAARGESRFQRNPAGCSTL
ncbi:MAG: sulfotransferase family 2 domain-containing protein [Verrucomicrobiota bacterium]